MAPNLHSRREICQTTMSMTPNVIAETTGASTSSIFVPSQLPSLSPESSPHLARAPACIIDSDSFTAARDMARTLAVAPQPPTSNREHGSLPSPSAIAVLNLASDELPGGGWEYSISTTQEEALCYSSTLYSTLKQEYYPWPNTGPGSTAGIYSPGIVIFRDDLDHGCNILPNEQREVVAVITVVAPRFPKLSASDDGTRTFEKESDLHDLREKIRLVYRMAAHNGQRHMVLGAMGCGAYGCPKRVVAEEMKAMLENEEFDGWFENVVFAVYGKGPGGAENFRTFRRVFEG